MLEKITIRRHDRRAGRIIIDPGLLAEALLFYGHVHLLLDWGSLESLLKSIGPDALLALLKDGRASATWLKDTLCVVTNTMGDISFHKYTAFSIAADSNKKQIRPKDWVVRGFEQALGNSWATRRAAKQFIDLVEFRQHEPVKRLPDGKVVRIDDKGITVQAEADTQDLSYLRAAIEATLRNDVPGLQIPANWRLDVFKTSDGFVVSSGLNFEEINREYHKSISPKENSVTMAWLLSQMLQARADLYFAADYMSEFATDPLSSALAKMRFNDVLKRQTKSSNSIEAFQDAELKSATAIRDVINSGERTFDEFMHILDKADRFKDWLRGKNPDINLLAEYHEAVTRETWVSKLPPKAARFVFFSLAGVGLEQLLPGGVGLGAGLAIGAADSLLIDKVLNGWRPNHFVEGPLLRFVDRG